MTDSQRFIVGDGAQYFVPSDTNYAVSIQGTGSGSFNLFVRQTDSSGNELQIGSFNSVPVSISSHGTFSLNNGVLANLQYDFSGKGSFDSKWAIYFTQVTTISCGRGRPAPTMPSPLKGALPAHIGAAASRRR